MAVSLERASDHHVERRLGLRDPPHAVSEPGRAETVLAEQVTLTTTAEHLALVDSEIFDHDLAVPGAAVHRLDLADLVPTLGGQIDQERRVGGLGQIGSSSVRATRIAKLARWALEMNHLCPLSTHSSPSW